MKTRYALLFAALTVALTSPMYGWHGLTDTTRSDMKHQDLSSLLGKPTAEASAGGLHMRVWVMSQEQHKEIMKEKMSQMPMRNDKQGDIGRMEIAGMDRPAMMMPKDMKGLRRDSMGLKSAGISSYKDTVDAVQGSRTMNTAMMDSMKAGTHHIVLDVTEIASGKEIVGDSASVMIESPSKKSSTVDLKSMMEHFGGALTLNEKGEYRFTVKVGLSGVTRTTQFQYAVK